MRRSLFATLVSHRTAAVGAAFVLLAVLCALLAPWIAPHDPLEQYRQASGQPPGSTTTTLDGKETEPHSVSFVLGTDINGRDIWSRLLYGARISLLVGLVATVLNIVIGALIGLLAGYYGRWVDGLLMRVTDTFFAFPGILLAIIILATLNQPAVRTAVSSVSGKLDPGIWGLFIALGLTGWTGIARVIRGQVLALKEREFIEAARAVGAGDARIMLVHLLPNCLAPLIVLGTMQVAYNILSEAGLSFLGLGIQPPAASWGGMLAEARPFLRSMPWWGTFPGIALALTVLGFNLFGDGLRDLLDPRLRIRI